MGTRIACHFANVGCEVLLLDIAPKELDATETKKGLSLESPAVRNRIVNQSLQFALKSNPSPIYLKSFASRIKTGNFDDDLHKIKDYFTFFVPQSDVHYLVDCTYLPHVQEVLSIFMK